MSAEQCATRRSRPQSWSEALRPCRRRDAERSCRRSSGAPRPPRRRAFRSRRQVPPLRRPAWRRSCRCRYHPLPLAPCLLQPANRRGPARSGARCAALLERRGQRRRRFRARKDRGTGPHASPSGINTGIGRDHRRRRGRKCGRRNSSKRRLHRPGHHPQRRRRPSLRPAEPVERLSGGKGAGGMDRPPVRGLLRGARNRRAAELARGAHRHRRTAASSSRTANG